MKKIIIIIAFSFVFILGGITYIYGQMKDTQKIVLQPDVQAAEVKEKQAEVTVEKVDLRLPNGEYFSPGFYSSDKIYGDIDIGEGLIHSSDEFPVMGSLKENLYQLKRDNIIEPTSKKVFTYVYGSRVIGFGEYNNERKLYSIDYSKDEEPKELVDLNNTAGRVKFNESTIINEIKVNDKTAYYKIVTFVPDKGSLLYLYDVENNKLYNRKADIFNQDNVVYIDSLKSFIWIDKDLKCYKVVFDKDEFDYKEFIDLKPYVKDSSIMSPDDSLTLTSINEEEVLISTLSKYRNDGYFFFHPAYETKTISSFNFRTNQFKELFEVGKDQHISTTYAANVKALGGYLIIMDEYENKNDSTSPKVRYFNVISNDKLSTIYKEDIHDEGDTLNPYTRVVVSESGREMFLAKHIAVMKDNIQTSTSAVYKRYIFK